MLLKLTPKEQKGKDKSFESMDNELFDWCSYFNDTIKIEQFIT
jgi:hypothetical protein